MKALFALLGAAAIIWPAAVLGPAAAASSGLIGHVVARFSSPLASRFHRASLEAGAGIAGIVLLGGNIDRVPELVSLARRLPGARVIVSGPGDEEIAAVTAASLGPGRMRIDPRPRNTYENALFSREMARPRPGERWLLVTSAVHMPRAMGAFRSMGFAIEAWPVDDTPRDRQGLVRSVGREIAGLLAYRLLGHTTELFPSPPRQGGLRRQAGTDERGRRSEPAW